MDKILSPIKQRILQYIDFKGIVKENFYEKSSISASNFKSVGLKSEIGGDKIAQILSKYPDINPEWLLTGNGSMLKTVGNNRANPLGIKQSSVPKGIPLLPIDAYAGLGAGEFIITDGNIEEHYFIPEFKSADFLIPVKGSSMQPKYNGGDILACKHIKEWSFFQWGVPHLFHVKDRGVLVKRPYKGSKKDTIELRSDNAERYPPFEIHTSDIINLSIVIGVIRLE